MALNRIANAVSFNTGISLAEYNEAPAGQTPGQTQKSILPGSTTVSEALSAVFPKDATALSQLMGLLAAAGNATALRTSNGFHVAAKKTMKALREKGTAAGSAAADEIERLLEDNELLDFYRSSLIES